MDYSVRNLPREYSGEGYGIRKSLYTTTGDRRKNIYEVRDVDIRTMAKSVACILEHQFNMVVNGNRERRYVFKETITLAESVERKTGIPFGELEKFRNERLPNSNLGTGFKVGKKWLLTAAHVVGSGGARGEPPFKVFTSDQLQKLNVIFGFMIDENGLQDNFKEVHKIKKIIAYKYSPDTDWALIKLEDLEVQVEDIASLPVNFHKKVEVNCDVSVIGHSSGLPLKFADEAKVKRDIDSEHFEADPDTFGGNSGSPVFSGKEVVGILFRGNKDYEVTEYYPYNGTFLKRSRAKHITEDEMRVRYEKCQRTSTLKFVQLYLQSKTDKENGVIDTDVLFKLALHYFEGTGGVEKNIEKGLKYLDRIAIKGDKNDLYRMGIYLLTTRGQINPWIEASKEVRDRMYRTSEALGKKAYEYFSLSFVKGSNEALLEIAICLRHGIGVTKDKTLAFETFKKAASLKVKGACYEVGLCYLEGKGVKQHGGFAVDYFKLAVKEGDTFAHTHIAYCFHHGINGRVEGVDDTIWDIAPNRGKAIKHYKKFAQAGHISQEECQKLIDSVPRCIIS